MTNRYNELSYMNQGMVDALINALAANPHVRFVTRELIMYDAITKIHDAGREATVLEESERCDYCTAPHTNCAGGVAYHCDDHEAEAAADAYPEDAR